MANKKKSCIWYSCVSIPSNCFPRFEVLRKSLEESLLRRKRALGDTVYETFQTHLRSPNVVFFSQFNDIERNCDFLPEVTSLKEHESDNFTQIKSKVYLHGLYVPQMYVVCTHMQVQHGNSLKLLSETSTLLSNIWGTLDSTQAILYVVKIYGFSGNKNSGEMHQMKKKATEIISRVMNDVDKKLITRVFFQGENGIIGRCSRMLEERIISLTKNTIECVQHSTEMMMYSFQDLSHGECIDVILPYLARNKDKINENIMKVTSECVRPQSIATEVACHLTKEMNQALIAHVQDIMSNQFYTFRTNKVNNPTQFSDDINMIILRILEDTSSSRRTLNLSDFLRNDHFLKIIAEKEKSFSYRWNDWIKHEKGATEDALCDLRSTIQQEMSKLSEQIPFEVQLALSVFREIRAMKFASSSLTIKVTNAVYSNKSECKQLKNAVEELVKDFWAEFQGEIKIVAYTKGIQLMKSLESGCTICIERNGKARGIGGVFGKNNACEKFIFTCSHVVPPGHVAYTEDQYVIGKAYKQYSIETSDIYSNAMLDFVAIRVSSKAEINLQQFMRHPYGSTSKVKIFNGDFRSLERKNKKLFMIRSTEKFNPIFVDYKGETYEHFESGSDESDIDSGMGATAKPSPPLNNGTEFRRIDTLESSENFKIKPGDSGSVVCYYDAEQDEVTVVFLVMGGYGNDEIVCCRFAECLQCLKLRGHVLELLR